jgi:Cilia BBSome complex subunit 10
MEFLGRLGRGEWDGTVWRVWGAQTEATDDADTLTEVLPKRGLVYSEQRGLREVLCKPKLMAIKGGQIEKLEALEREERALATVQERARTAVASGAASASSSSSSSRY